MNSKIRWEPCYRCPHCGNIIVDVALHEKATEVYTDIKGGPEGAQEPAGYLAICPVCKEPAWVEDI